MDVIINDRGLVELISLKRYIRNRISEYNAILNGEKYNVKKLNLHELKIKLEVYKEILMKIESVKEIDNIKKSSLCDI